MLRIAILVAAGALIAAPASAESITISTAGKSTAQIHREVVKAAVHVCRNVYDGIGIEAYMRNSCVSDSIRSAMAQVDTSAQKVALR